MPDYSNGVIYMLEPTVEYEKGDIYYGSTTQPLHKRLFQHKCNFIKSNPVKSKILFEKYGIENVKIILIKYYPCNYKKELEAEEATYIRNNKCVNRIIPGRSIKEYYEDNKTKIQEKQKEYYEDNKTKIQEKHKEYYEDNKTKIQEKQKEYWQDNKRKINEQQKQYYEDNKQKFKEYYEDKKIQILEQNKEKIKCDCGCEITKVYLNQHQQSKKHIKLLEKNNSPSI